MTSEQLMRIYLAECSLHAAVLDEALVDARSRAPLSSGIPIEKEMLRTLDQIAYRFAKLQDPMGEKVLPLILEMAQEPIPANATFAEKLNRLERIGAIPSAEDWKKFRVVRNALAHDYPDDPELRASAISRFLEGAANLSALYRFVREYVAAHFPMVDCGE
ncbi:MAG: hypothetical protein ACYCTY_12140 [Sulfuricella sp.]